MKETFILTILCLSCLLSKAQDYFEGQVCLKKNKVISRPMYFTLYADSTYLEVSIDSTGRFKIEREKVAELGTRINFFIGMSSTHNDYADFEFLEIPFEKMEAFLTKIIVKRAYINWRCGYDCFNVNNFRTYWRRKYLVDNGQIKYLVKRVPRRGLKNNPRFDVKYQANFQTDVISK
jgi:hypothetical protein